MNAAKCLRSSPTFAALSQPKNSAFPFDPLAQHRPARNMLARQLIRSATRIAARKPALTRTTTLTPRFAGHAASSSQQLRNFTVSSARFEQSALTAKLAEELAYENEQSEDPSAEPQFITDFKNEGIWKITDKPGADEIILERSFGNENIRLLFSIADLDAEPQSSEFDSEEPEEYSASADAGSGGLGDESTGPTGASEDSFPLQAAIVITKPGGGALSIDAVAQDGLFSINNVTFYQDAAVASSLTSEAEWTRQGLYMGPAFENLDEGVQNEFEAFLEERGINSSLALFIPDLAEHKEQKEYVAWLENVKNFLER